MKNGKLKKLITLATVVASTFALVACGSSSSDDSKVYDKNPLTNHNVAVEGDGFVKEEGATYNVTGSQTSVGESDNEFTYTLKSNTKAENYNITTHNGKLIVTAEASEVTVVITGRTGTFPYDGTEKSVKGYDVLASVPLTSSFPLNVKSASV